MAIPINVTTVTVTHTYTRTNGQPAAGTVTFAPRFTPRARNSSAKVSFTPTPIAVPLTPMGMLSVNLMSNNDPDVEPRNWSYQVTEAVDAGLVSYDIILDFAGPSTVDLADLLKTDPTGGTYSLGPDGGDLDESDPGADGGQA